MSVKATIADGRKYIWDTHNVDVGKGGPLADGSRRSIYVSLEGCEICNAHLESHKMLPSRMLFAGQQLICQTHMHNSSADSSVFDSRCCEPLPKSLPCCLPSYRQRNKAPTANRFSPPPNLIRLKQRRGVKNPIGMWD